MSDLPIAEHALVSDCRSAALVSRTGSVDWLCLPRFDSPSLFGRLLDDRAGHWSIRPTIDAEVTRRYVDATMLLETVFSTATGTAALVDGLAVGRNDSGHELGAGAPSVLLRHVTGLTGSVEVELEFAPRPEYGLISPLLHPVAGGLTGRGGADVFALSSPVPVDVDDEELVARARVTVATGETVAFALSHASSSDAAPRLWSPAEIATLLDDTIHAWRAWSELHQHYDGRWRELVHHSGRVLYALTYYPTGAICAAATTSLPEAPGGSRNWDYRYAWLRDASFTVQALSAAACPDEAGRFFDFAANAAASLIRRGADLPSVFGVGGERDLSERELPHLSGWRNSAPVRVGNGAWTQRQIDVYGELLDAAACLPDEVARLEPATAEFLARLADTAAARWQQKDHGIWEIRGEPRHFLHSKLMCWVALDRAIALADTIAARDRVDGWARSRVEIAETILDLGWSDAAGSFTQSFGSDDLDASNLMMPIVGFLPADHPRIFATIEATSERLTDRRGLVYRYRSRDGLDGSEGCFLLCTFWLAHAFALAGELDRAVETFERAASYANDVGLLSEQVDPATGELLGNFPQAFSHVGLINAARAIHQQLPVATASAVVDNERLSPLPAS
jgi:GH15 family glucan-1,4-alpha-glucosidase